jgi:sugar (pentulose or hexulose) kinase
MLAATGIGIYSSLEDAVDVVCKDISEYEPNKDLAAFYDARYEVYKDLYHSLLPLNARIRQSQAV